ncbi:hypothetical protein LTS18_003443 [Coniosporium uncinatum]|uniref:Uncharacterized protein n=1 Tax=Coniosporium uncinatum TaxID=93489 RepID=A0ACC3D7C3_9PEZI|nr:hypothetical protein LTS18_003443 [Coniosporium uncinatum]
MATLSAVHLASATLVNVSPEAIRLNIPSTTTGSSFPHSPSFASFSFEPAFWVKFFGNATSPNPLTFELLSRITERGGSPIIRPGGITMDSMIFDPSAGDLVRTTNAAGGVYRTTVGPAYYQSWSNFPYGTKFVSTLNFGNNSLDVARDMAVASQWKQWTAAIDLAVNQESSSAAKQYGNYRWWASSATTDVTGLNIRPADLIPAGIDSANRVAEYSIHSYAFATCDPARAALATIPNILNHTELTRYADEEIVPSAQAALDSGKPWVIGEFNSIACSGNPNVSDTFAQALWTVDVELIYAVRNASSVHLHQGATLAFQSNNQVNTLGADRTPGFSTYDILYPKDSSLRGKARALPGFVSQLFMAEAFATPGTQVSALEKPEGVDRDYFSTYAFYVGDNLSKLAIVNSKPYHANATQDYTVSFGISKHVYERKKAWSKRMIAPHVEEKDTAAVTWASQSYEQGLPVGGLGIERVERDAIVHIRGSEAVLVFFDRAEVYGAAEHQRPGDKGGWWHHWNGLPIHGKKTGY